MYGQKLKAFREEQGWSLREMAVQMNEALFEKYGISHMAIFQWETGKAKIPIYLMSHLAQNATGELKVFAEAMVKALAAQ